MKITDALGREVFLEVFDPKLTSAHHPVLIARMNGKRHFCSLVEKASLESLARSGMGVLELKKGCNRRLREKYPQCDSKNRLEVRNKCEFF